MITTSFAEIFAGDVPRIDSVVIFPDQRGRSGVAGSTCHETQVSGKHLVGFNIKPKFVGELVDHFKIENPVLLTRRGGGFAIEYGEVPECFRITFSLEFHPSFKEDDLPKGNGEVREHVREIREMQGHVDRGVVGFSAYCIINSLWGHVKKLNRVLGFLEQPVG